MCTKGHGYTLFHIVGAIAVIAPNYGFDCDIIGPMSDFNVRAKISL